VFSTKPLNIKFFPDIISCWPLYNYQFSLQIAASTFRVQAVQNLKLSAIHTKYRKKLIFTNSAVPICIAASPPFTVLPVPDTRTNFTYCCSFNWKRNTNVISVLSIFTWALDTGELLGSNPRRFIPSRLGGPRASLEVLYDTENTRLYRNSKPGIVQLTAPFVDRMRDFLQKTQAQKFSNLRTDGCCYHSCSFVYLYLSVLKVMYLNLSCEDISKEGKIDCLSVRTQYHIERL